MEPAQAAQLAPKDDFQFNVLVVDDDASILSLMKEVMSMVPGCNVTTAGQPSEAMKEVVKGNIDIIFTDVHMPGHSGLEFLQDIVALEHTPEVIVMTSYPTGENAQQAMELGATSFISKPFEDISVVEVELEKAIKKVIRQRAADRAAQLKKIELSKKVEKPVEEDPALRLSIPPIDAKNPSAPASGLAQASGWSEMPPQEKNEIAEILDQPGGPDQVFGKGQRAASPVAVAEGPLKRERKAFDGALLEPLIEIEIERCKRYNRQFAVGYIDLPEDYQVSSEEKRSEYRDQQIARLERNIRKSDVLLDAGRDGMAVLGFECNKVGSEVMEHKLLAAGFEYSGFAIHHPGDGVSPKELQEAAKAKVQNKRKLQILLHEPEEFFGRLVSNMLMDPKYNVTWSRSLDETYKTVLDISESVKLMVISLTRDKEQWKLIAKMLKEGLVKWPILLFVDVPLARDVKDKLSKLGVRAIVNKSASQEEFIYLVQSFVIPKPFGKERKNYRALVALPVSYKVDGKPLASNTFTLSKDGLFVRDMNPPPSGQIVDIEIFTPEVGGVLKCKAEVLYAVPYFVGVNRFHVAGFAARFIDITDSTRERIELIVSNSLTSYLL